MGSGQAEQPQGRGPGPLSRSGKNADPEHSARPASPERERPESARDPENPARIERPADSTRAARSGQAAQSNPTLSARPGRPAFRARSGRIARPSARGRAGAANALAGNPALSVTRRLADGLWRKTELSEELARITGHEPLASTVNHWALILASKGIPYRLSRHGRFGRLHVSPSRRAAAIEEITSEPHDGTAPRPVRLIPRLPNAQATLLVFLGLFLFHGLTQGWWIGILPPETWIDLGGLDAASVWTRGEWYRVVTALTLHANSTHIFGNIVFGCVALVMLCRRTGTGLGWFAALAAGALGNTAMLFLRHDQYLSIGFSTAIFGAMGVLCSLAAVLSESRGWRRLVIPIAAGLAWLGLLGSGGREVRDWSSDEPRFAMPEQPDHTDVGAHFMGLAAGLPLGALIGWHISRHGPPRAKTSVFWGALALGIVGACWALALRGYAW